MGKHSSLAMRVNLSAMVFAVVLSGFVGSAEAQDRRSTAPRNLSSHPPEFFRELLTGRVWVYERKGSVEAMYLGKDGVVKGCWFSAERNTYRLFSAELRWRIGTPRGRSNLELNWPTSEGMRYGRRVIIYAGETGRFHSETFGIKTRNWRVDRDGWIQDGWPAAFRNACNEAILPWDVKTVSEQDSLDFAHMKRNATPIVRFPGWELSFPGATGIADSGGKPTMTIEEVLEERRRTHGMIRLRMTGERSVGVDRPDGIREIWLLDDNDDVVDVAEMRPIGDGSRVRIEWEKTGQAATIRVGYPVRAMSTGKYHPAFLMMFEAVLLKKPVELDGAIHVFQQDGKVASGVETGEWWLSGGAVYVKIAGRTRNWPWRVFAGKAGLKIPEGRG